MMQLDRALFDAARAGDPPALERLLRQLQPDIRRYARRQCHRASAVEDVVQEALIVVYRRLSTVRDLQALPAWVSRTVSRLCMLPVLGLLKGMEDIGQAHASEHLARRSTDELRLDVVRALESLPDIYREAILLRDLEQCTITEVAQALQITREAAKSRIHRGRVLMREYLHAP